jgi:hypothetical protein
MARVAVSTSSNMEPGSAWKLASDLDRFDEWMTIFGGWRSEVPSKIEEGTQISSCVKVKGFRNVIHWTVTHYDEPKSVELQDRGRGGIRITVILTVAANDPGRPFISPPVSRVVCSAGRSEGSSPGCCGPTCVGQ